MKKWAVLVCLLLAACSTTKPIVLPSGAQGYIVQCNGTMNSDAGCAIEAGKACPQGYAIVDRAAERGMIAAPDGNGGFNRFPTATRSMMIQCR